MRGRALGTPDHQIIWHPPGAWNVSVGGLRSQQLYSFVTKPYQSRTEKLECSRNVEYGTEKVALASHEGDPHAGRGFPLLGWKNGKHLLVLSFFAFDPNRPWRRRRGVQQADLFDSDLAGRLLRPTAKCTAEICGVAESQRQRNILVC